MTDGRIPGSPVPGDGRAAPDLHGRGPGWQRRHDDRDELDDRLEDDRRSDEGWRATPDGYSESYW